MDGDPAIREITTRIRTNSEIDHYRLSSLTVETGPGSHFEFEFTRAPGERDFVLDGFERGTANTGSVKVENLFEAMGAALNAARSYLEAHGHDADVQSPIGVLQRAEGEFDDVDVARE